MRPTNAQNQRCFSCTIIHPFHGPKNSESDQWYYLAMHSAVVLQIYVYYRQGRKQDSNQWYLAMNSAVVLPNLCLL